MVNGVLTIIRFAAAMGIALLVFQFSGGAEGGAAGDAQIKGVVAKAESKPAPKAVKAKPAPEPEPTPEEPQAKMPPPVDQVLKKGVLIVISKSSQQMHVFKDGAFWNSSPVSTGKRGKETPSGMFPILQKRVHHRSNLYSNAPMPHMQRLTWDGIAIHAGALPGYPASHGCIRLPSAFARSLFNLTKHDETTVVVTDQASGSSMNAMQLAKNMPMPLPGKWGGLNQQPEPRLALAVPSMDETDKALLAEAPTGGPMIQLAAAGSVGEAEAHWARLTARHPELNKLQRAIIPATVGAQKVYRLRAFGPNVQASCSSLREAGTDCFAVS